VNLARGYACEYVAWRFITHLSGRELINFLLYELPSLDIEVSSRDEEAGLLQDSSSSSARTFNATRPTLSTTPIFEHGEGIAEDFDNDPRRASSFGDENRPFVGSFNHLNALEVAAVSDAKKFLAQRVVQRIIESIWKGDIVFWETFDVGSEKAVCLPLHECFAWH
jgi:hypothetical protein